MTEPSSFSTPALSIVIPMLNEAGNAAPLIAEITASFKNYMPVGENFEIVCVDDGSTDGTPAEVKAAQAQDKRVRLIRHPARLGMSAESVAPPDQVLNAVRVECA